MRQFHIIKRLYQGKDPYGYIIQETRTAQTLAVALQEALTLAKNGQLKNASYNKGQNTLQGEGIDLRKLPRDQYAPDVINEDIAWCLNYAKYAANSMDWWYLIHSNDPQRANKFKSHLQQLGGSLATLLDSVYTNAYGGWFVPEWRAMNKLPKEQWLVGSPKFTPKDVKVERKPSKGTAEASVIDNTIYIYDRYLLVAEPVLVFNKYKLSLQCQHEIGHILSSCYPKLEALILDNPYDAMGRFNQEKGYFAGNYGNSTPEESFADTFMAYCTDQTHLKTNYPMGYKFMSHILAQIPDFKEYLQVVEVQCNALGLK